LIERFSGDIDTTVFREDIGLPATVEELEALNGKNATPAWRPSKPLVRSTFKARCWSS